MLNARSFERSADLVPSSWHAAARQAADMPLEQRRQLLLEAAKPFTSQSNVTFIPWLAEDGLLDDFARDRENLSLSENALSISTALVTGLTLLLLTDTVFRIVVRTQSDSVTTAAIFRCSLLSRASNPLYWPSMLRQSFLSYTLPKQSPSDGAAPSASTYDSQGLDDDDETKKEKLGSTYPSSAQVVAIVLVGLFVTLAQLLILIAATTRRQSLDLDRAKMPALTLHPVSDAARHNQVPDPRNPACFKHALVDRPGFDSLVQMRVCALFEMETYYNDDADVRDLVDVSTDVVLLRYRKTGGNELQLSAYKRVPNDSTIYTRGRMRVDFATSDGALYTSHVSTSRIDVTDALLKNLRSRGLQPVVVSHTDDSPFVPRPNWEFHMHVPVGTPSRPASVGLPANYVAAVATGSVVRTGASLGVFHAVAWAGYLSSVGATVMNIDPGLERATRDGFYGAGLEDFDGPIAVRRRPWLGLLPSIVLAVVVGLVWLVVVFGKGWNAGIDYSFAWCEQEFDI